MNIKNRMIRAVVTNALFVSLILAAWFKSDAIAMEAIGTTDTNNTEMVTDFKGHPTAGISLTMSTLLEDSLNSTECSIVEQQNTNIVGASFDNYIEDDVITEEKPMFNSVDPYTMYIGAFSGLRVRTSPDTSDTENIIDIISVGKEVTIIGETDDGCWAVIEFGDSIGYLSIDYLSDTNPMESTYNTSWNGEILSRTNGRITGPNGDETYYNLPMDGCIRLMNSLGYYGKVWVREDGVKMWDNYIMIAADLNKYPKGSLVEISLGTGIVVDTGGFVYNGSGVSFDVATTW